MRMSAANHRAAAHAPQRRHALKPAHAQRGGVMLDVFAALAIGSMALMLYSSTPMANDQDQISQQMAWAQRMQHGAVSMALRANMSQLATNPLLSQPNTYIRVPDALWAAYLPDVLRNAVGQDLVPRLNARQQKSCVLMRQEFTRNVQNQDVGTGFYEVVLAQTGGNAYSGQVDADIDLHLTLGVLESEGLPSFYTSAQTGNSSGFDPKQRLIPFSTWGPVVSQAAQQSRGCLAGPTNWEKRIWSKWRVDGSGAPVMPSFTTEFLARSTDSSMSWLQNMNAPLRLGDKGGGNVANVHNLSGLTLKVAGENCQTTDESYFAQTAEQPTQLLQCKNDAGVFKWKTTSGLLATGTAMFETIYPSMLVVENTPCADDTLGTIARSDSGAPMVCTGSKNSARRWVRMGVPWAWVIDPKPIGSHSTEITFAPDAAGSLHPVPVSARLVQLYIEGTAPAGSEASVKVTEIVNGQAGMEQEVFKIYKYDQGVATMGRTRLFDRREGVTYKFTISSAPVNQATLKINLLGYSY